MIVLSIDVGIVNIGVALLQKKTNKIRVLFADKFSIVKKAKDLKETSVTDKIFELFFIENKRLVSMCDFAVIEVQMKPKYKILQYSLGAFFKAFNTPCFYVSPRKIKTFYKFGKSNRKTAVKGKAKNHSANKREAVAIAYKHFPEIMSALDIKKQDDVADALLQGQFVLESNFVQQNKILKRRKVKK